MGALRYGCEATNSIVGLNAYPAVSVATASGWALRRQVQFRLLGEALRSTGKSDMARRAWSVREYLFTASRLRVHRKERGCLTVLSWLGAIGEDGLGFRFNP